MLVNKSGILNPPTNIAGNNIMANALKEKNEFWVAINEAAAASKPKTINIKAPP